MKLPWQWASPGGLELPARAKINWTLDIVGRRADGYHLLDTVMQPLALRDTLRIVPDDTLTLKIEGSDLAADESNLVLRAARALQSAAGTGAGACMTLTKRIPLGAGLGGGSADAAAALRGLNELWGLRLEDTALFEIGLSLGADVPFCLFNRPARARGIGEELTPVVCGKAFPLVLLQPCAGLSTRDVFAAYAGAPGIGSDTPGALAALEKGDLSALAACARNALEPAAATLRPEILSARGALLAHGAVAARMTGSGSVVYGAFETRAAAERAARALQKTVPVCIVTETAR